MRTHARRWLFGLLATLTLIVPNAGCKTSSSWSMSNLIPWTSSKDKEEAIASTSGGVPKPSDLATPGVDVNLGDESRAMASMPSSLDRSRQPNYETTQPGYPGIPASYTASSNTRPPYSSPAGGAAASPYTQPQQGLYDTGPSGTPGTASPYSPTGGLAASNAAASPYGGGSSGTSGMPASSSTSPYAASSDLYGVGSRPQAQATSNLANQMFGGSPNGAAGGVPSDPFGNPPPAASATANYAPRPSGVSAGTSERDPSLDMILGKNAASPPSSGISPVPYRPTPPPYVPPMGANSAPTDSSVASDDVGSVEISKDYASAAPSTADARYVPGQTGYTPGATSYSPPDVPAYGGAPSEYQASSSTQQDPSPGFAPGSTSRYPSSTSAALPGTTPYYR